jgi:serine/threonine kinase 16
VVQDTDGDGQIVYLFLPLYSRGNLQDAINTHSLNGTHFSETEILRYFKGTCEAVRAMHTFHAPLRKSPNRPNGSAGGSEPRRVQQPQVEAHQVGEDSDDEGEQNQMLPEPEGDEEGGYSYDGASSRKGVPLLTKKKVEQGDIVFDGDQELADSLPAPDGEGELVPYAHRDLKPGYV